MYEENVTPSGLAHFQEYENELKSKNRFFVNNKFERLFTKIITEQSNILMIRKGTKMFRARKNRPFEHFTKASEIGTNKVNLVSNRASPPGIFYMYLADIPETAIAEIRPNVKQDVTVATYKTVKKLKFLLLKNIASQNGTTDDEFDSLDISGFVIYLSYSFSKPIHSMEIDYLPSQYFAEYCKNQGFDGIQYISSAKGFKGLGNQVHYNYVLFDEKNVAFQHAFEYKVTDIQFSINQTGKVEIIDDSQK